MALILQHGEVVIFISTTLDSNKNLGHIDVQAPFPLVEEDYTLVKTNGNLSISDDMSLVSVISNKPYVIWLLKSSSGDIHLYRQDDAKSQALGDIRSVGGDIFDI